MIPNDQNRALAHWLNARKSQWEILENKLGRRGGGRGRELDDARDLLSGYRALLSDLSLSRRIHGEIMVTRYLENLCLKAHEEIYRPANRPLARLIDLYHWQVPSLMRQLNNAIASAWALFMLSMVAGWLLVRAYPELISLIASPEMISQVQHGELWTDGLLNLMPSSILSVSIAANNIAVTLFAFALGAFYGVGTLYILGLNGFMLGGIFAFTAEYDLQQRLFAFIVAHGVVELSVIIIAGAMGLQLGEALIRPGSRNRLQAFQATSIDAGKVLLAATPFLIFAGLIEGFVSPDQAFNLLQRGIIGICSGTIFWLIMLFGIPGKSRR
ncbi:stage II sporulation protein M [Methylomonas sp. LL1]|uniref:stage II sporulation protein M n=1 Tax=Methylomonas sp. LL1 TaxID=2785785 RepID=UPI0018C40897|nr:stage II sporulation protein M [Methylomonas sp. LL1]QPK63742.1 stage II sporulation protein M [Methylomonas sp. LL1]